MNNFWGKIGELADAIVKIDEKVGFRKLLNYVLLLLALLLLFNFRIVTREVIEFVQEISEQIHDDKMVKRDELMQELAPLLQEFRAEAGADRILYLEYHNSKENLVGIPFKYIDLVQQNSKYGVACASVENFKDINVGLITDLYSGLKNNDIIICKGEGDREFLQKYQGAFELFNELDNSRQQAFISIPGVSQPIGLVVLEWIDNELSDVSIEAINKIDNTYRARINALILKKR